MRALPIACLLWLASCHPSAKPAVPAAAPKAATAKALTDADSPVPITPADPSWGSREAPVTLVVFSDFQCPYCARVEPTLAQIKDTYGPKKIRIVWKNYPLPFHDQAESAAEVAMGAFAIGGAQAFWKLHDQMFANQRELGLESYLRWAGAAGIDPGALRAGLEAHTWRAKVQSDHALGERTGVSGTPATFVNGMLVSGALPFEYFKPIVDEQLENAQTSLVAGTPPGALYATLSRATFVTPAERAEKEAEPEPPPDTTVWKVPIGQSPVRGPKDALVTIVTFSDFQCPYCKKVQPTLKQIEQTYGKKVRFVWKDQPLSFHPLARRAAIFAREARAQKGDAGFWAAHDKLFELQPAIDKPDLERAAKDLGLDLKKVQAAAKDEKFKNVIDADIGLAGDLEANGTPQFFVNGRRVQGAKPYDAFVPVIDEALKNAEALVAAGTPAAKVYDTIMATAKPPPEPEKKSVTPPTRPLPSKGPASAKVTITEFSDFQCPFCAKAEATLEELRKTYGDKIRIVSRDLPLPTLHPNAQLAAEAGREAFAQKGNAGYWKMRELLYAQKDLGRQALETAGQEAGLDPTKLRAALDGHVHAAAIEEDVKAADAAKISATPTFLVGDYLVSGAMPAAHFRRLIDRVLEGQQPKKP